MSELQFRPPRPDERALYCTLVEEFYRTDAVVAPIPRARIERTFDRILLPDTDAPCLLFQLGTQVVGYALLARMFSQEGGGLCLWLEEFYVRPAYAGQGIGSAFLRELRRRFPQARLRLEIAPGHDALAAFYGRFGFVPPPYLPMQYDPPRPEE